jgi:alcohol dehydrogenase
MQAFDYQPSNRVICGQDAVGQLPVLLEAFRAKRVLVVTDAGIEKAGILARIAAILAEAGCTFIVFNEVNENPSTRDVQCGLEAAKAQAPIDLIVGLGGGSPMDCAKGINFLYSNGGRMQDYWGKNKARKAMLPAIGIPTTAGTGSEAQSYALICDADTRQKMACGDMKARFQAVILDPTLLASMPERVSRVSGIDAIAHALESYVSKPRTAISNMFAREAWRLLSASFLQSGEPETENLMRHQMQLGAYFAGMAIENAMLGAAHACANPLTARFGITHGIAVAIMLPHVIRFNQPLAGAWYSELTPEADTAALFAALVEKAGLPTALRAVQVPASALDALAGLAAQEWTGRFNPRPVQREDFLQLYRSAY